MSIQEDSNELRDLETSLVCHLSSHYTMVTPCGYDHSNNLLAFTTIKQFYLEKYNLQYKSNGKMN